MHQDVSESKTYEDHENINLVVVVRGSSAKEPDRTLSCKYFRIHTTPYGSKNADAVAVIDRYSINGLKNNGGKTIEPKDYISFTSFINGKNQTWEIIPPGEERNDFPGLNFYLKRC